MYEIQTYINGWENVSGETDESGNRTPLRFSTLQGAEDTLTELLNETGDERENYRIFEPDMTTWTAFNLLGEAVEGYIESCAYSDEFASDADLTRQALVHIQELLTNNQ